MQLREKYQTDLNGMFLKYETWKDFVMDGITPHNSNSVSSIPDLQ